MWNLCTVPPEILQFWWIDLQWMIFHNVDSLEFIPYEVWNNGIDLQASYGGFLELGTLKPMAYPFKIHLLTDLTNPQVLSEHLQESLLPGGHLRAALWRPNPHVQCAREVSDSWSWWFSWIHHWIGLNRGIYRYLPVMFSNFWWFQIHTFWIFNPRKWEDDLQGHFHFSGSAVFPKDGGGGFVQSGGPKGQLSGNAALIGGNGDFGDDSHGPGCGGQGNELATFGSPGQVDSLGFFDVQGRINCCLLYIHNIT